jgi:hypothetical protein
VKKFVVPILLSVLVNVCILSLVLFFHQKQKRLPDAERGVVNVQIGSFKKKIIRNNAHVSAVQWIHQHYHNMLHVDATFTVSKDVTGYVVSMKSDPSAKTIIYSLLHGKFYFIGSLLGHSGKNISIRYDKKFIADPESAAIYHQSKILKGVIQGDPKSPLITIIIDPSDPLFVTVWKNLSDDIARHVFAVNWVLVNYLNPEGPNIAGLVLQSRNPVNVLNNIANHRNGFIKSHSGVSTITMNPRVVSELKKNWDFVNAFKLSSFPVTILSKHHKYYVFHGFIMDETLEMILNG